MAQNNKRNGFDWILLWVVAKLHNFDHILYNVWYNLNSNACNKWHFLSLHRCLHNYYITTRVFRRKHFVEKRPMAVNNRRQIYRFTLPKVHTLQTYYLEPPILDEKNTRLGEQRPNLWLSREHDCLWHTNLIFIVFICK